MKLFEAVKEAVTARSAAEYYGIKVGPGSVILRMITAEMRSL